MGFTATKLLIVLAIIIVVFGTKKLRNIGTDIGEAIRGFRTALKEGEGEKVVAVSDDEKDKIVEGETVSKVDEKV
jgi:sec-independent protein translocase protein TatA